MNIFNVKNVGENIDNGTLIIRTNLNQREEPSCDSGIWYSSGYADKELKIIK
ncbi:MAG: hypothetical protein J1G30_06280 [Spirochaetales bacterium]|nr:hypothetical protein [Spirochaetales bacterium]